MDRIATIVSITRVWVSCVVGVWLVCISVVPTTVRESSTPDSKENKQIDSGMARLHGAARYCGTVLSAEREGLSTHVQRKCSAEPFKAASCVSNDIPISPRYSPIIFYRDADSVLLSTPLYSSIGAIRRTLCSKFSSGERESLWHI